MNLSNACGGRVCCSVRINILRSATVTRTGSSMQMVIFHTLIRLRVGKAVQPLSPTVVPLAERSTNNLSMPSGLSRGDMSMLFMQGPGLTSSFRQRLNITMPFSTLHLGALSPEDLWVHSSSVLTLKYPLKICSLEMLSKDDLAIQ
eukprot:gnl/TRDRNA2_/TRDRNA2_130350_c0_seq1.p2 gnl/TRDRNA2_/TRDRNA2_130350_c0~~gnl/TRDRNA2_/TRDRNA2_130350_c0_seq1.p2  ORF type:complete len:146 (-),score=6.91 gnl/TRDRNA2_/TRDRNA2_130350_c0_seq1:36-473(-)